MSGRWGWLGAAIVAGVVVFLLFATRTGRCFDAAEGSGKTSYCTSTPLLGNGLTWTLTVLIGLFVAWCVVHLVAPRR